MYRFINAAVAWAICGACAYGGEFYYAHEAGLIALVFTMYAIFRWMYAAPKAPADRTIPQ